MWKTLLRKSILNVRMLVTVLLGSGMMISSFFYQNYVGPGRFNTGTDILTLYTVPFATSSFIIFCGVFPAIPYAYSFIEERNCGYLKFIQIRTSRKVYAAQKIFFTGLAGGAAMLFMGIIVFAWIDFIGVASTPQNHQPIFETLIWGPYMYTWGGRVVFIFKGILMFLFGVMWSELALMVSLIFKNKYVAYVLPFLLYELAWLLIPDNRFNPVFLVRGDFGIEMPLGWPFGIDLIYILIITAINGILFWRQRGK